MLYKGFSQVVLAGEAKDKAPLRGVHRQVNRKLKRIKAIETVIGHPKTDGHLDRNFLKAHNDGTKLKLKSLFTFRTCLYSRCCTPASAQRNQTTNPET